MSKLIKYSWIVLALSLLGTGCADDRNNFMVDDSFCLTAENPLLSASVHAGEFAVGVIKSGKGLTGATARISIGDSATESALEAYNRENGTSFEAVPANLFSLKEQSVPFAAGDFAKSITLTWDPGTLAEYIGSREDCVIPVRLVSDDLTVNPGRSFALVRVLRSSLRVTQTRIGRSFASDYFQPQGGRMPDMQEVLTLDIENNSPLKGITLEIPFSIDNSLIDEYNAQQEDTFVQAPEGLITFQGETATMAAGKTSAQLRLVLDRSMLQENGVLKDFPDYVIPVRLDEDRITATRGGEAFTIDGMAFGNTVTYITVRKASEGIVEVSRAWGRYSSGTAWYSDLEGFAYGADRTIAMDDEYVYVAHANGKPAIYALRLADGQFSHKLDITPALANGCTFPVSVVRMMPNAAGKDILLFSSLRTEGEQTLYVYAYVNGTDKAPVQILAYNADRKPLTDGKPTNDWRRYGDRFTVEGTWQEGRLWFHAQHNDKTVIFNLKDGVITNPDDPTDYLLSKEQNSIKEVTLYPGAEEVLVTSPNQASFYRNLNTTNANGWINWAATPSDVSAFRLTYGYNFFSFHGKKYIAYVKLDNPGATTGRLVIIEDQGKKPADFEAQLLQANDYREFPVQDAESFDTPSSISSASSVGDCTVRNIDGNAYVAVLVQGCGLSLFVLE